jgi:hypothetical protein
LITAALAAEYGAASALPCSPPSDEDRDDVRGLASRDHPLYEGDHAVDHAAKVDADQPVEIAVGRVLDRAEAVDSAVLNSSVGGAPNTASTSSAARS